MKIIYKHKQLNQGHSESNLNNKYTADQYTEEKWLEQFGSD